MNVYRRWLEKGTVEQEYAALEELEDYQVLLDDSYTPRASNTLGLLEIATKKIHRVLYWINGSTLEILQNECYSDNVLSRTSREINEPIWEGREFRFMGPDKSIEEVIEYLEKDIGLTLQEIPWGSPIE